MLRMNLFFGRYILHPSWITHHTSSNLQHISESPPSKQRSTSDANMPVPSSAARGCTTLLASDRAVRRVQSQQNRIVWSWDQSDLYNLSKHGCETVHLHPCQRTIGLAGHTHLSVLLFTVTAAMLSSQENTDLSEGDIMTCIQIEWQERTGMTACLNWA